MLKVLISLFLILNISLFADECIYGLDKNSLKVEWEAFKTPQKVKVKGRFKSINISVYEKAHSVKELLEGSMAIINTKEVDTNNTSRDKTLFDSFFSYLNPFPLIKAHITDVNVEAKAFNLNITMNGMSKVIPMRYTVDTQGNFISRGKIDMVKDFGLDSALKTLNKACFDLHKGVTWPDVNIFLKAKLGKYCKKSTK